MRLQWEIKYECNNRIEEALKVVDKLIADIDLRIYVHDHYGKGFMKQCRLSPDAYLQMALQLAYYRDAGKFSLTYEASMTRLYREGRTETVRPCTIESSAWVKAMENKNYSTEEKVKLLRIACERHQVCSRHPHLFWNDFFLIYIDWVPRCHVWKRNRQAFVLSLCSLKIFRGGFTLLEGSSK